MTTPQGYAQSPTTPGIDVAGLAPVDRTTPAWPIEQWGFGDFQLAVRRRPRSPEADDAAARFLFVHGLGGSSLNWLDLGEVLSPTADIYAVDLPGFGFSAPPVDGRYRLRRFDDAVIAVLERIGGAHLVGNSLGGAVAARVAACRGDLVDSLALISPAFPDLSPAPRLEHVAFSTIALGATPVVGQRVFGYLGRRRANEQVRGSMSQMMVHPEVMGEIRVTQAVDFAVERAEMPWAAEALADSFITLAASWMWRGGRDYWDRAARITAPTLVLWGRDDRLINVRIAQRVAAAIPGADLVVLDGVGHVSQMEDPQRTAQEIARLAFAQRSGDAVT